MGPLPVATLGIAGYAVLVVASIVAGVKKPPEVPVLAWSLMVVQSLAGIGFIGWLIGLQWIALKHFCIYCLTAHLFGMIAFLLVLWGAPVWHAFRYATVKLAGSALAVLSVMIGIHILVVPNQMITNCP